MAPISAIVENPPIGQQPGDVERRHGPLLDGWWDDSQLHVLALPEDMGPLEDRSGDTEQGAKPAECDRQQRRFPECASMGADWQISIGGQQPTSTHRNDPYTDDSRRGVDPASITGTIDAVDLETGVYGTAGTPVTCGYGMSGSTIGIGHALGRRAWEEGTFLGSTPGSYTYEHGGTRSGDAMPPSR